MRNRAKTNRLRVLDVSALDEVNGGAVGLGLFLASAFGTAYVASDYIGYIRSEMAAKGAKAAGPSPIQCERVRHRIGVSLVCRRDSPGPPKRE